MGTFLFDKIIFGPVQSRRLGVSLGVNLLPINKKVCNFNCIYCECGLNGDTASISTQMPTQQEVKLELEQVLTDMQAKGQAPNVITFAGNGEPTIHKDFEGIIDDTIELRNRYFPKAKIAVLTNGTLIHKPEVASALKKIDDNILKLDSGIEDTIRLIDQPNSNYSLSNLLQNINTFEGNLIIQTLFVHGTYDDKTINNTTEADVNAWLKLIEQIAPKSVMIYTIERDTPKEGLKKVNLDELNRIAQKVKKLGIATQVSG